MREAGRITNVRDAMLRFARKTGLSPRSESPVRYLWTDAYAVCNFLALHRSAKDVDCLQLALDLVAQVHETLGRHRQDDGRQGWISGMSESEGRLHPTAGGLRIGKKLPDQKPHEPANANLEWDRDGQYFHYLTKWMHALRQVNIVTGDGKYVCWADELAKVACEAFARRDDCGAVTGLVWKMNVDLTCPVVASMGQHDPLDGYVTLLEIDRSLPPGDRRSPALDLSGELGILKRLCIGRDWTTGDALGVGGLLFDACRLIQLHVDDDREFINTMLTAVIEALHISLLQFLNGDTLQEDAAHRLAFRELGLSIGLHAIPLILDWLGKSDGTDLNLRSRQLIVDLESGALLANAIENFWLHPAHRRSRTWLDHEDINMVMLAASMMPGGVLRLQA